MKNKMFHRLYDSQDKNNYFLDILTGGKKVEEKCTEKQMVFLVSSTVLFPSFLGNVWVMKRHLLLVV